MRLLLPLTLAQIKSNLNHRNLVNCLRTALQSKFNSVNVYQSCEMMQCSNSNVLINNAKLACRAQ